jgi:hypothetical protein
MTAHPIQYESTEQAAQREQNATPPFYLRDFINYPYTDCCSSHTTYEDSQVTKFVAQRAPTRSSMRTNSGSLVFLPVQRAGRANSKMISFFSGALA